jgi:vancomycin permeability regulator SanA
MTRFLALAAFRLSLALAVIALVCLCLLTAAVVIVATHFEGKATLPADCALVFGAAVYGMNVPGPAIVRRVGTAAALHREGSVGRLFLSGGRGGDQTGESEAHVMREQAMEHGVPSNDIVIEEEARSTWENLMYTRPLMSGCQSVVGISDRYHLARITLLARRQGWGTLQTIPADVRADRAQETRSILREAFGYVYYFFHIDTFLPTNAFQS